MSRLITFAVVLLRSAGVKGHHWVGDIYDGQQRFIVEVEVREFELMNSHPLMYVEIVGLKETQRTESVDIGQTWTLEMDNRRELTALGFNDETFIPGDRIFVAVNPSRHTFYREYNQRSERDQRGIV